MINDKNYRKKKKNYFLRIIFFAGMVIFFSHFFSLRKRFYTAKSCYNEGWKSRRLFYIKLLKVKMTLKTS